MTKQSHFTRERIEAWLSQYREKRCKADELRLDIEALQDNTDDGDAIEAATFAGQRDDGMPRDNTPSDVTGRLATSGTPDCARLREYRRRWRELDRQVRRMDAWIAALPYRERLIIDYHYRQGMTWADTLYAYRHATNDCDRSMNTILRWRNKALSRIESLEDIKWVRFGDEMGV